ncbi:MAG TPA: SOS response-associated peptidase [Acidobacteriota bacterium]|nr:SOS response-associated peptidase [Acidobacteriota bacterium]
MCGRYTLTQTEQIPQVFEVDEVRLPPRFNIAPSQMVPAVTWADQNTRQLDLYRWGLIPYWAKDEKIGFKMINARCETVASKTAFRNAFQRRRCLLPADGYYEWRAEADGKQPFLFRRKDRSLMALAGLWERWKAPDGHLVLSCTILTTRPNPLSALVHDRMPVILPREGHGLWLDPSARQSQLEELLKPYPAQEMEAVAVSRKVNSPHNDGPEVMEEVEVDNPPRL